MACMRFSHEFVMLLKKNVVVGVVMHLLSSARETTPLVIIVDICSSCLEHTGMCVYYACATILAFVDELGGDEVKCLCAKLIITTVLRHFVHLNIFRVG